MFRVTISYIEHELTRSEVRELSYQRFGGESHVDVEFSPVDSSEEASLDFVLDSLLTENQSNILFGDRDLYELRVKELKESVLQKVSEHVDKVIKYNETRL